MCERRDIYRYKLLIAPSITSFFFFDSFSMLSHIFDWIYKIGRAHV